MDFEEIGAWLEKGADTAATEEDTVEGPTLRERFLKTMAFETDTPIPNFEFGYWDKTLEVWREQGMPAHVVDEASAYAYFGIENWAVLSCNPNPMPVCKHEILRETEDRIIYRDHYGCVAEINRYGDRSIPHYLEYPIKDRASWEAFREKAMDPAHPDRWVGFEDCVARLQHTTQPIGVHAGSLMGVPRNLIGFEQIATMPYEDPELLTDIINSFGECIVAVLEKALPRIQVDLAMGWEDICFNSGPILPPDYIREVVGPWYARISALLRQHGCLTYTTDTDGNIWPIVDIFLDNGLDTMFPVEVHAGTDPVDLREKYGKDIKIWGGVCKMRIAEDKAAIDREMERLRPCVEEGGFIPTMDHRVPANITYANYLYYLDRKRDLFNIGGMPQY